MTRALVVGLGIEGVAMARFLAGRGASVTVTDDKPAEALAVRVAELAGTPVTLALGGADPALAQGADMLYVSQSVPLGLPLIAEARKRGLPVQSIASLAYEVFQGKVAAITGSSGKTTTTSLVSAIFTAAGRRHVFGGNVGRWPLDELAEAGPQGWAVLELSHTQLQLTTRSPHVACVTNVTPNHLDQFSWDEYVALKRNHVAHQSPVDLAVLNLDNPITRGFRRDTPAELVYFSMEGGLPGDGAYLADGEIIWRYNGHERRVMPVDDIPLRGRHNIENVLAAAATSAAAGIGVEAIAAGVSGFRAVPHRIELVAEADGVQWYNDSIATTPERTLAGMRSFHEPLVLLLGGRDKNLPLDELATACRARCRAVITFGEAGALFANAVRSADERPGEGEVASGITTKLRVEQVTTLDEAVHLAATVAQRGDVVLLSPAGTSFDAYPNFERRGEHFRALVGGSRE
jgi:UDP-N-acetylmuramoylalanine--D-glutamate ligase